MKSNQSVATVIVTYNRKEKLVNCIESVINQSINIDKVFIVDNNSTDGTDKLIKKKGFLELDNFKYIKLKKNRGSSGGFYNGIKRAYEGGFDWVWIMDDDVIPNKNALEKLTESNNKLQESGEEIGFLSSRVLSEDKKEMNVPTINKTKGDNGYPQWSRFLNEGVVELKSSTFVSLFVSRKAITEVGFPTPEFFIWGDDIDYTLRITDKFSGFFVGDSIVTHLRETGPPSIILESNPERVSNFYYMYRNNGYIMREYYGVKRILNFLFNSFVDIKKIWLLSPYKILKTRIIIRGLVASIFFNPKNR